MSTAPRGRDPLLANQVEHLAETTWRGMLSVVSDFVQEGSSPGLSLIEQVSFSAEAWAESLFDGLSALVGMVSALQHRYTCSL